METEYVAITDVSSSADAFDIKEINDEENTFVTNYFHAFDQCRFGGK